MVVVIRRDFGKPAGWRGRGHILSKAIEVAMDALTVNHPGSFIWPVQVRYTEQNAQPAKFCLGHYGP